MNIIKRLISRLFQMMSVVDSYVSINCVRSTNEHMSCM